MRDGFISVACGTPKLRLGDCACNAERVFAMMRAADKAGASVLVLPELGLTGCTCGDLFFQNALLQSAEEALATVLEATRPLELIAAVGLPLRLDGRLYDCAAVIQRGKILGLVPKTHLSDTGEARWFTAAPPEVVPVSLLGQNGIPFGAGQVFRCRELPELALGFEIGADLWASEPPSVQMSRMGAVIIGNLAAGREYTGRAAYRRQLTAAQSARLLCGYVLSGAGEGESTTDAVFGAHQMIAENGSLLAERRFDGGLLISEIDTGRLVSERRRTRLFREPPPSGGRTPSGSGVPFSLTVRPVKLSRYIPASPFVPEDAETLDEQCRETFHVLSLGLKRRLEAAGARCAVLGLSGGLDSTLAALTAVGAMDLLDRPHADVIAVTMPGFGTTEGSRGSAEILSEQLGCTLRTVDITASVLRHFHDIGHDPEERNNAYENAQARERTQILMDIANDAGGLVIGTGDLSESALGWCTYNGDHMSMYGVNSSLPKTLIRALVGYAARSSRRDHGALADVLEGILNTPISPELLPAVQGEAGHRTEELVGPYELHDFYLYYFLRWGFGPGKILRLAQEAFGTAYSREILLKWLRVFCRRFFSQQFKRNCMPDGPRASLVTLSPRSGWEMPSDASAAVWLAELDALEG